MCGTEGCFRPISPGNEAFVQEVADLLAKPKPVSTCFVCGGDFIDLMESYAERPDGTRAHYPRCAPGEPKPDFETVINTWSLDLGELLQEVGILMRDRHKKYGAGNISKRGIPGVLVRLDDKLARIDNGDMDFADESYRDAWMDVVGYGLVALMCLDGNWPGVAKP